MPLLTELVHRTDRIPGRLLFVKCRFAISFLWEHANDQSDQPLFLLESEQLPGKGRGYGDVELPDRWLNASWLAERNGSADEELSLAGAIRDPLLECEAL